MHLYNNIIAVATELRFEDFFFILQNMWIYHKIPKTKEKEDKIHEALKFLENVLKKSYWAAGKSMTVADFSLVASISTFKLFSLRKFV